MRNVPYACPETVEQALETLAGTPGARPIAGGTDLLVQLERTRKAPPLLVSLHAVAELRAIAEVDGALLVGAGVTLATLERDERVQRAAPLLSRAAASMASPTVRSRGTLGGNLCNASPAADLAPPLLVHEAEVVLRSRAGERRLPLAEFLRGPGQTALAAGELLTAVVVPALPAGMTTALAKHQVGRCGNLSIISASVGLLVDAERGLCSAARVALGAVAPTAARYPEVERKLVGTALGREVIEKAAALAGSECSPIDDVRASCDHRCHLVTVLLPRVIDEALGRTGVREEARC